MDGGNTVSTRNLRRTSTLSVTNLPLSPEEEQKQRFRKYLIAMIIRLVCLALAVLTTGVLQWVGFLGAIFLPYFAVVLANASGAGDAASATVPTQEPIKQLAPTTTTPQ